MGLLVWLIIWLVLVIMGCRELHLDEHVSLWYVIPGGIVVYIFVACGSIRMAIDGRKRGPGHWIEG